MPGDQLYRMVTTQIETLRVRAKEGFRQIIQGFGGAERDRTAGLLVANEALSQLSYSPTNSFDFNSDAALRQRRRARNSTASLLSRVSLGSSCAGAGMRLC
jgi:hypothetical protein